jgi:uncharacterized protein (DUF433 family)
MKRIDIYNGKNPLQIPFYTVTDASRFLHIPLATVKSWTTGRQYPIKREQSSFKPIVPTQQGRLSFSQLVELYILRALRKVHKVDIEQVRKAINYAEKTLKIDHLLLSNELLTGGGDLFIERYGQLISLNKSGQLALKTILQDYLERVERDIHQVPIRLYPYINLERNEGKEIVIDPRVSFGYPTLKGTGIKTSVIVSRIDAGESLEDVANDYELSPDQVKNAVLYEQVYQQAA